MAIDRLDASQFGPDEQSRPKLSQARRHEPPGSVGSVIPLRMRGTEGVTPLIRRELIFDRPARTSETTKAPDFSGTSVVPFNLVERSIW